MKTEWNTDHKAMLTLRLGQDLGELRPTLHNGPGRRINLWFQGCSLRCTSECLNPHLLDPEGGMEYAVERLAEAVTRTARDFHHEVAGVTVLGGEPTDQMEGLIALLDLVRRAGLDTMVYTGRRLEGLQAEFGDRAERLLVLTDILVDGPFIKERYDPELAWRGSDNQRLLCLSDRYDEASCARAFSSQGKSFSIHVRPDGRVSCSGFQNRRAAAWMEQMLGGTR